MSSVCDVCGKKPVFGMRLSHSHRRTKRRWNPNVQRVRAVVNGSPKRINACTSGSDPGRGPRNQSSPGQPLLPRSPSAAQRCGTKPGLPSVRKRRKTSGTSPQWPDSTRKRAKWVREISSGLPAYLSAPS